MFKGKPKRLLSGLKNSIYKERFMRKIYETEITKPQDETGELSPENFP